MVLDSENGITGMVPIIALRVVVQLAVGGRVALSLTRGLLVIILDVVGEPRQRFHDTQFCHQPLG